MASPLARGKSARAWSGLMGLRSPAADWGRQLSHLPWLRGLNVVRLQREEETPVTPACWGAFPRRSRIGRSTYQNNQLRLPLRRM